VFPNADCVTCEEEAFLSMRHGDIVSSYNFKTFAHSRSLEALLSVNSLFVFERAIFRFMHLKFMELHSEAGIVTA
jgi:hypothetical protein